MFLFIEKMVRVIRNGHGHSHSGAPRTKEKLSDDEDDDNGTNVNQPGKLDTHLVRYYLLLLECLLNQMFIC